jgi:hypothetical protein
LYSFSAVPYCRQIVIENTLADKFFPPGFQAAAAAAAAAAAVLVVVVIVLVEVIITEREIKYCY